MARYRRYRRTIIRAPKKKWASNMMDVNMQIVNPDQAAASPGYHAIVLAQNKTETSAPTPVIIKTGNFKLQADIYVTTTVTASTSWSPASLYIVFIPQGMEPLTYNAAKAIIDNHPEWILAWRFLEAVNSRNNTNDAWPRFTISSRLKRNLNSGDSVYALLIVESLGRAATCTVKGMCQFWTCAN